MKTLHFLYWEMLDMHGPLSTPQIAQRIGKPRNTVSTSLRVMRDSDYVTSTQELGHLSNNPPHVWTAAIKPPENVDRSLPRVRVVVPKFPVRRELNVLATMRRVQL